MEYNVITIGGGLSGLTEASLLAKRNLKLAVIEKSYNPGGSCGVLPVSVLTGKLAADMVRKTIEDKQIRNKTQL